MLDIRLGQPGGELAATGEVARALAEAFAARGRMADVQLVKHVKDISPYSAVIVGSAIRMGHWLPEAVECSERACAAARLLDSDAFVWEEAFSSAGYTHWCTGNVAEAHRLGAELLAYGTAHTNIRCLAFGHWMVSLAYLNDGDFKSATEETDKALRVSADPWLLQFPKFFSAICSVFNGEFDRALPLLEEVVEYSTERGAETLSIPATGLLGAARARLRRRAPEA